MNLFNSQDFKNELFSQNIILTVKKNISFI